MATRPLDSLIFSRDAIREVDRRAVEEFGIPSILLMENASRALADAALRLARATPPRVLILVGPGNNGGDGLAAARFILNAPADVSVALAFDPARSRGDPAIHLEIAHRLGVPIALIDEDDPAFHLDALEASAGEPDVLIDALLGTGLTSPLRAPILRIIPWINARRDHCRILAADIPTGLDADTGRPTGDGHDAAVRAHHTVTFAGRKRAFSNPASAEYIGEVSVADIGVPRRLLEDLADPPP